MRLSPGADCAWMVAANEVAGLKHPAIEGEHLVLGICGLEKCAESQDTRTIGVGVDLMAEIQEINQALGVCHLSAWQFRRLLRQQLPPGEVRHAETIHRSEACKAYVVQAGVLAAQYQSRRVRAIHLFMAVLEKPGPAITAALQETQVEIHKLRGSAPAGAANGAANSVLSLSGVRQFQRVERGNCIKCFEPQEIR